MTTTHLTAGIETAVSAESSLLYFTAGWCGPCKAFGPIVEKFKTDHPDVVVSKIDVDEKRDLATLYGVRGIPTVIALRDGNELGRHTGLTTAEKLEALLAA